MNESEREAQEIKDFYDNNDPEYYLHKKIKMKKYTTDQITDMLHKHKLWLKDDKNGAQLVLVDADLTGADFTGANLKMANFSGSILRGADFYGSEISSANFSDCDLEFVNINCANIIMNMPNFFGTIFDNLRFRVFNKYGGSRIKRATLKEYSEGLKKELAARKKYILNNRSN
jgi:hypothetical protein